MRIDKATRRATLIVSAPKEPQPEDLSSILARGAGWWPLQMARELDDAVLMLRTNQLDLGTWILQTRGDIDSVLAVDASLEKHASNWFVREVRGMLRRTLARRPDLLAAAPPTDEERQWLAEFSGGRSE